MRVEDILNESARTSPARPAIIDEFGILDYRTLRHEVEEACRQLRRLRLQAGQGVGVMARNGRAFVIGAFAALRCGACVVPIWHRLSRFELELMQRLAPLHAVLHDQPRPELTGGLASGEITLGSAPPMYLAPTGHNGRRPYAEIVPDAAFVRFTSGTTGASKGVVLSHAGVLERTAAAMSGLRLTAQDRVLWVLPMAFHFFVSIVTYLRAGAAIVVCGDHFARTILQAAARHDATFLYASPLHYRMLASDESGCGLAGLRHAVSTSAALPPSTARSFMERYGLPVAQAYGIIEVGLPLINLDGAADKPQSVGAPAAGYEAAILDDDGRPMGDGQVGQLAVRGPGMFAAYLVPPRPAGEVLRDGWFLTGDLACRDRDGAVTIVGRAKAVINVAGNKVFPEEVEAILDCHPHVVLSRVSARAHGQLGEVVHAQVVLRAPAGEDAVQELLSLCRARLSGFKVPHSIEVVERIEQTHSGKVRRH